MKRILSRWFQSLNLARNPQRKSRKRRWRVARFEQLERRQLLAADPILMASGADLSSPLFSTPNPDPVQVWIYDSAGVIGKDAYGNKIDFNQDGYGDTLQTGRVDEIINYKSSNPLVPCSRGDFIVAELGGSSGAQIPIRKGDLACGAFPYSGIMVEVTAIDLNHDGYQDLLGLGLSGDSKGTEVRAAYWDQLTQSFSVTATIGTVQAWGAKFASWQFGDVNGDGILDMVTPNFDPASVNNFRAYIGFEVYLGIPDGGGKFDGHFQAAPWATVAARTPVSEWGINTDGPYEVSTSNPSITPVLADLNGDGKLDLAIPEIDGMSVFTNPGNGQFVPGTGIFTAVPAGSHGGPQLKAGDLDKDGDLDLVDSPNLPRNDMKKPVSEFLYNWEPAPGAITVFQNNSVTGGPPAFTSYSVVGFENGGGYNGQVDIADLNNDGKLDLAVASAALSTLYYGTLQGNGDGTFGTLQLHVGYADDDGTGATFHRGIRGIAAIDSNNDGLIDIATVAVNYGAIPVSSPLNNPAVSIVGVSLNKTYRAPTVVTNPPLPIATQGKPYSYQLVSSGGNPNEPLVFSLNPNSVPLPAGLTLTPTGLLSGTPTQSGPFQLLIDVSQPSGIHGTTLVPLTVNPGIVSSPIIVAAPEKGGEPVRVMNVDGSLIAAINAFYGYKGAVRVATGDVTGDGKADILAICGSGITTEVRVFDGTTFTRVLKFAPFGTAFKKGGYVAVGDVLVNHPGVEIVVSPLSGREKVRVFDNAGQELTSFLPYTKNYSGAVPIAVGNIDGKNGDEIAVAIGTGRSEVRWFDGYGNLEGKFAGHGNQIAVGDVDGDGKSEVVLTAGKGNPPIIRVYDPQFGVLDSQFTGADPKYRGGLRVALVRSADGSRYDIVTAFEAKKPTTITIRDGRTGAILDSYLAYPSVFVFGLNIAGS